MSDYRPNEVRLRTVACLTGFRFLDLSKMSNVTLHFKLFVKYTGYFLKACQA